MYILNHVDREFWLAVAQQCPSATFFHTPLWQDIALGTFPAYRDATIGAVLDSGVRVVLPLISVRQRGPLHELWSSFELYYGGLIADGPYTPAEAQQIYRAACGWRTLRLWLTGNPLTDTSDLPAGYTTEADFTQIIPLQPDFEQVFASFPKNTRATYRSGVRQGVQVRRAAKLADCHAYYNVYQDGMRRWAEQGKQILGVPYTLKQFELCYALSCQQPNVAQLWLAEVDGGIVAGGWVFYWNQHSICWQAAMHSDFLSYRPFNVLEVEMVRDAALRGYAYFDLGPSGGVEGVIAYKDRYRTTHHPFTRSVYTSRGGTLARHARTLVGALRTRFSRVSN